MAQQLQERWVPNEIVGYPTASASNVGHAQVKHSGNVGRKVVNAFETAIRRAKKMRGMIVALSFARGAVEEAAGQRTKSVWKSS